MIWYSANSKYLAEHRIQKSDQIGRIPNIPLYHFYSKYPHICQKSTLRPWIQGAFAIFFSFYVQCTLNSIECVCTRLLFVKYANTELSEFYIKKDGSVWIFLILQIILNLKCLAVYRLTAYYNMTTNNNNVCTVSLPLDGVGIELERVIDLLHE